MNDQQMDDEHEDEEPSGDPDSSFSFEEARVLGCLIEKEATTPDYYPMTVNALLNACNQKNNREPVTAFDSSSVETALQGLRDKGYAARVAEAGARASKYRHTVDRGLEGITRPEQALLCVMLLRGPQTLGELRGRSERIHLFHETSDVEATLEGMMNNFPSPVAVRLPPGGGRKVSTYAHLLCGDVEMPAAPAPVAAAAAPAPDPSWREEMEQEVAGLKRELGALKEAFDQFRNQLGG